MSTSTWTATLGRRRFVELYCQLAGLMDAVTGLLLLTAPDLTLRLMGIGDLPTETLFLRWIGVFVAAVGLAYLYPFVLDQVAPRDPAALGQRLTTVLEITALERLAVGAFVAASVATSALALPWISVAVTDLGLATLQLVILRKGWLR